MFQCTFYMCLPNRITELNIMNVQINRYDQKQLNAAKSVCFNFKFVKTITQFHISFLVYTWIVVSFQLHIQNVRNRTSKQSIHAKMIILRQ